MQRDIVYRNIAATHIACDTEGMLHGEISHGNFIIFDTFLARFWFKRRIQEKIFEIFKGI